jgi:uncharacterized membrane protein YraQ (UPF0718 family)
MVVQSLPLGLQPSVASSATWRSRSIAILLMIVIAGIFWVDSRYPALMKRYNTGAAITAKGSLTFGLVYNVDRSMPLATRVWRTTVNWLDANRVGMTFSFLFGPAALTFLAMLRRRRTTSVYLNTLFGAAAGAPLAVCTNCIAPIARGFFASGMSTESVLAAMFASPALNVVVLAMTFALFPTSIAWLKLFTVLFLIFVFVPLVARDRDASLPVECAIEIPASETWGQAFVATFRSYFKNFWYISRVALPLMLLAAFLGAFVIEILPAQALFVPVSFMGIVAVAIVSSFLPVPMAFDVAIAYILMVKGAPLPYCVTILCTLGVVSVFSLSIVGKTASWKIAGAAYATTVALGTAAGIVTKILL